MSTVSVLTQHFETKEDIETAVEELIKNAKPDIEYYLDWTFGSSIRSLSYLFENIQQIKLNVGSWNLNKISDLTCMFLKFHGHLTGIELWDVSNVITFDGMFSACASHVRLNLKNWRFNRARTLSCMFHGFNGKVEGLANWDVSRVREFIAMFKGTSLDLNDCLKDWNMRSATNLKFMFYAFTGTLSHIDNWDVSYVRSMEAMFGETSNLHLDLSKWDMRNVDNTNDMFGYFKGSLRGLNHWDVSNIKTMDEMFNGAEISILDVSNWNLISTKSCYYMFYAFNGTIHGLNSWDVSEIEVFTGMFPTPKISKEDIWSREMLISSN